MADAMSVNHFPKVIYEERLADGSDTPTPAVDHRAHFLGEDGLMYLKDSAGVVTPAGGDAAAHIADAADAHDASAISVLDAGGLLAAADVEAALAEIAGDSDAHIADAIDAHDAAAISFTPTGTIAATDVQAAIAEVASEAGGGSSAFKGCSVYHSTTQAVSSGNTDPMLFNSEEFDADALHSTASLTSRITVDTTGKWRFTAHIFCAASAAQVSVAFRINGTVTQRQSVRQLGSSSDSFTASITRTLDLTAGDYVEVMFGAGATSRTTGHASVDNARNVFECEFLGT